MASARRKINWVSASLWGLRLIVALAFIYAGVVKLRGLAEFAQSIHSFQILPRTFVSISAYWIPWLEMTAATALLLRPFRRGGAWVLGILLLIYIVALASAEVRGLQITCDCFGAGHAEDDPLRLIARDLVLLGMLLIAGLPDSARQTSAQLPVVNS